MKQLYNPHDVFCAATAEEAREYIGQEGYFANSRHDLDYDIKHSTRYRLDAINDENAVVCFEYTIYGCSYASTLFIPECKVKREEAVTIDGRA